MRGTVLSLAAGALLAAACSSTGAGTGTNPVADARSPQVMSTGGGTATILLEPKSASLATAVAAPPERVWAALSPAYGDLGISVTEADENAHTLGNGRLQLTRRLGSEPLSRLISCGQSSLGASIADTYRVRMSVRSTVVPEGAGSRILTTVEASARTAEGTSNQTVACTPNDRLALLIAERVRLRIGAGS